MTWQYIAGFLDGEGTIARHGKGYRITITQTNRQVLQEIQDFSGVGGVSVITKRKDHWKDAWIFYISKQESVHFFLKHITPFLIVKKELANTTLSDLKRILLSYEVKESKHRERIRKALKLRKKGLSYWRIGQEMGLDRGYLRRLILKNSS